MVTRKKRKVRKIQWGCAAKKGGYRYINSKKGTKSRSAKGVKMTRKRRKRRIKRKKRKKRTKKRS